MALTLPLVASLASKQQNTAFGSLDQPVLAVLLTELFMNSARGCVQTQHARPGAHFGNEGAALTLKYTMPCSCCPKCASHFDIEWRKAAERIERDLLQRGWGYA